MLSEQRLAEILRWHVDCECGCVEVVAAYDERGKEVERLRAQVAAAWDEGWDAGVESLGLDGFVNPYRTALASTDEVQS